MRKSVYVGSAFGVIYAWIEIGEMGIAIENPQTIEIDVFLHK